MRTFFTADLHFGHAAIMSFNDRPFATIEEHDEYLLERINELVTKQDRLFIVGDFAWKSAKEYVAKITCRNLCLIMGNHDRSSFKQAFNKNCHDVREIRVEDQKVFLSHYPHAYWPSSHHGSIHLYGHTHGDREESLDLAFPGRRSMDVGVDNAKKLLGDYRPFEWEGIRDHLHGRPGHEGHHAAKNHPSSTDG